MPNLDNGRPTAADRTLILFDFSDASVVAPWTSIDDRVMGGISVSRLRHDAAGHAVFEGDVSLDRHGGFASVRCSPGPRGMPGAQVCLVDVRGDGKRYILSLRTDDRFDSIGYQAVFQPDRTWRTMQLRLAAFQATWRGRPVPDAPVLAPAGIRQVGLMIADRQAGPFSLQIRRISLA